MSQYPNTQKLIDELLKISEVKQGSVSTAKDGTKYRYDMYIMKYKNTSKWLELLFGKAAEENGGKKYDTHFFHTDEYSISIDRPPFKGQPTRKIQFTKLVILK